VGEVAMLEPEDIRLHERVVFMLTEKHRRHAGRMERTISRRRIPLSPFQPSIRARTRRGSAACSDRPGA
jgi:hypothetical protein